MRKFIYLKIFLLISVVAPSNVITQDHTVEIPLSTTLEKAPKYIEENLLKAEKATPFGISYQ